MPAPITTTSNWISLKGWLHSAGLGLRSYSNSGRSCGGWPVCHCSGSAAGLCPPARRRGLAWAGRLGARQRLYNLIDHFPDHDFDPANIASYSQQLIREYEEVRDFIVLHYKPTRREDTSFWRACRALDIPDTLEERIEAYRGTGRIFTHPQDVFTAVSWFYILDGMGVVPKGYDPIVDLADFNRVRQVFGEIRGDVEAALARAPTHRDVLARPELKATATAW